MTTATFYSILDAAAQDTGVTSQGTGTPITAGYTSTSYAVGKVQPMFKFDLSSISSGMNVLSASFTYNIEALISNTFKLARITSTWDEAGSNNPTWDANLKSADFAGAGGSVGSHTLSDPALLAWIQNWVNGVYTNFGIIWECQTTTSQTGSVSAREATGTTNDPYLTVTYNAPPVITPTGVPSPSISPPPTGDVSLTYTYSDAEGDTLAQIAVRRRKPTPTSGSLGTTDSASANMFSNQKRLVRLSTGRLVAVLYTAGAAWFSYSDDGVNWTGYGAGASIAGWDNGSIASYVDSGGTEWIIALWKQLGTGGGRVTLQTYIMAGSFNAARTAITWGTALAIAPNTARNISDLVVKAEGTGGLGMAVFSTAASGDVRASTFTVTNAGVITETVAHGVISAAYGTTVDTYPSIDINPASFEIHCAWSAGAAGSYGKGIRYRRATYAAGAWTWQTEQEVDQGRYLLSSSYAAICRWDAGRALVVIAGTSNTGSNSGSVDMLDIYDSSDFVTFTNRVSVSQAAWEYGSWGTGMGIDPNTGDVYIFGSHVPLAPPGNIYRDVVMYRALRNGSKLSLGSMRTPVLFTGSGTPPYVFVLPTTTKMYFMYVQGAANPWNYYVSSLSLT